MCTGQLRFGTGHGIIGEPPRQRAREKRTDIARPIYFIERHSCRNLPATTVRTLRNDLQLYGHVFATNRNYG